MFKGILAGLFASLAFGLPALAQNAGHVVYFPSGDAALTPQAERAVTAVAQTLELSDRQIVRVAGYADATGEAASNAALSYARAGAVKQALVAAGLNADRIVTTRGDGAHYDIAHVADRRVTISLAPASAATTAALTN